MLSFFKNTAIITVILLMVCCANTNQPLVLVQLCDPQLGFGPDNFDADVKRLNQSVSIINELSPDAVLIAGDMVHILSDSAVNIFTNIISNLKPPVIMTPGNHDISEPVSEVNLKYYRDHFGPDYLSREMKGRMIISANSQLWREAPESAVTRYEKWLEDELMNARKKQLPVIMLTHVPPFVASVDEPEEYFNLPLPVRKKVLAHCEENGVFLWLSGHTHKTSERRYNSITILNGETTSNNFDGRPYGFRVLTINPDQSFQWQFYPLN